MLHFVRGDRGSADDKKISTDGGRFRVDERPARSPFLPFYFSRVKNTKPTTGRESPSRGDKTAERDKTRRPMDSRPRDQQQFAARGATRQQVQGVGPPQEAKDPGSPKAAYPRATKQVPPKKAK